MGRTSDAKERLLESCQALMHEKGYTAAGVSEVCSRAGVNKGSFYYFFHSKQDLALAMIERYASESSKRLADLLSGDAAPLDRLRHFFAASYEGHCESRRACGKLLGCPLGNLAAEMGTQDPLLRERLAGVLDDQVEQFATVIREALERGDLPAQDARATAVSILALIEGTLLLAKAGDNTDVLRDLPEKALRMMGATTNTQHNEKREESE